jgi:putative membrane protein
VRPRPAVCGVALALASPALAFAHEGHAHDSSPGRSPWEWLVFAGLLASVAVFARGVHRLWRLPSGRRSVRPWQALAFAGGWLTLLVALASPLDTLSKVLFSAHMTQHELLMLVAAPLFVLARPLVPLLWALPAPLRDHVAGAVHSPGLRAAWRVLTGGMTVWLLHGLALWAWHVPALFEAALASDAVHAVQHLSFFWTAVLFWWALVHGRYGRMGYGVGVLFLFTTALHSGLLGALLTYAPNVWYGTHAARTAAAGGSALEDQQLAGLIMWVPAGVVFIVVALALFAAWLGESERRAGYARTQQLVEEARAHAR